jgi:hypothetical protein
MNNENKWTININLFYNKYLSVSTLSDFQLSNDKKKSFHSNYGWQPIQRAKIAYEGTKN